MTDLDSTVPDDAENSQASNIENDEMSDQVEKKMQESLDEESDSESDSKIDPDSVVDPLEGEKANEQQDASPNVVKKAEFEQFGFEVDDAVNSQNIGLLMDVSLPVSIELGRTSMTFEDVLKLGSGSVVELNKLAGEPVDLLVNNKLVAKGEVVVVDENFGMRITEMVKPKESLR